MESNALARLKRLTGKSTLILTHYGRKSGKPYEVKIWFVMDGDKVFIGTANAERQWVKNVQKNPRITLAVGGEKFEAEARFLVDPAERDRGLAAIGRKYWMYTPFFAIGDADGHRTHAQPDWGVRSDVACWLGAHFAVRNPTRAFQAGSRNPHFGIGPCRRRRRARGAGRRYQASRPSGSGGKRI